MRPTGTGSIFALAVFALCLSACNACGSGSARARSGVDHLSEDEKHRLYSAALATSESPWDTEVFKDVCKKVGIFGADDNPNDKYMAFISEHIDWGMKVETEQFRQEINSKEKARDYLSRHLPRLSDVPPR